MLEPEDCHVGLKLRSGKGRTATVTRLADKSITVELEDKEGDLVPRIFGEEYLRTGPWERE